MTTSLSIHDLLRRAKTASRPLARLDRNAALRAVQVALQDAAPSILAANEVDVAGERAKGTSEALVDRLSLSPSRFESVLAALDDVIALPDPVGRVVSGWRHPKGMAVQQVTVPFGVIGMIYESRPNVTIDAAALCLKAGSAAVLRGSSSALRSNRAIVSAMREGLRASRMPEDAVTLVDSTDRGSVTDLLTARGLVDLVIPRGGANLIAHVVENARVPVIETGVGNCHLYVHSAANLDMALNLLINGKTQRPGVCNALETLLIDREVAPLFAPAAVKALRSAGVEVRGDGDTAMYAPGVVPASPADWDTEFLDLVIAVRIVDDLDAALAHIERHGTGHSEAIVTQSLTAARRFQDEVDAACVYVNASTRFTDGFEFGFGAEIGISTQKLHARGPMGLAQMVTHQYRVVGDGQVR
ncbi:glutamate-5-semialdehyde dehydrogenase [Deinococcus yavapaiensis]|uniref:Gamma-glutamyl phosphate reductase n=1 Tax=Deinococcus yavapaiensis KR-236 TaxID=694435 RepID=A0A318SAT2_9DEIO|nr:glutamate-5-semialdehyde dehydrogenase [Deinococcus yavapaiensis]PYE55969.1 glutamate-5-semialdehyde dehydrogenase [Deinococcus yavapaiensis KR-236]